MKIRVTNTILTFLSKSLLLLGIVAFFSHVSTLQANTNDWSLSCNDLVQVSLDQNGEATITPQMLLLGTYANYTNFIVEITDPQNTSVSNPINCTYINQTLTGKVTDMNTNNSCWGSLLIEDKIAPIINCPAGATTLACDLDFSNVALPSVVDNCSSDPLLTVTSETIDDSNICSNGTIVVRTLFATDDMGNNSQECIQQLRLTQNGGVDFPADIAWDCGDYAVYPNITDPVEVDTSLMLTGSGYPGGVAGIFCPYNATHHDDTLATCGGFKIIRTWVVLNWCTNQLVFTADVDGDDNEQHIIVEDLTPPSLQLDGFGVSATIGGQYGISCASVDFVPGPTVIDNCSDYEVRIFTTVGEIEYLNGIDGQNGGNIPSPGLPIGQHFLTYEATDACGNTNEIQVPIEVRDITPPVPICDQITDVNLGQDGTIVVDASVFDDGSYDHCCFDRFEVKREVQSDTFFAPTIVFDCDDVVVEVEMRVYDCFGNFNDCSVIVEVQDKLAPICIPPNDITVDCTAIPTDINSLGNLDDVFGAPSSFDNCGATVEEQPVNDGRNSCGDGGITRNFIAIDEAGNQSLVCKQLINIRKIHDWEIQFPANWYGQCGDDIASDPVVFSSEGCDQWATSYTDEYFDVPSDSACFKLIRTWKVRNWCTFQSGDFPVIISTREMGDTITETSYNNDGFYQYQQLIFVRDTIAPNVIINGATDFCSFDDDCMTGMAILEYSIQDDCTQDVEGAYEIDLNQDGSIDVFGTGTLEEELPIGCHDVIFIANDGCGNTGEEIVEICVEDCKQPTPYCKDGLIVEIMQTGLVEIWATDFDDGSFDNCDGDLILSFSADTSHVTEVFTCWEDSLYQEISIQIWVTDASGNQSFCETFIIIQDNFDYCLLDDPLIAGHIEMQNNEGVENVEVELSGSGNVMNYSNDNGYFEFMGFSSGNDYTITPSKNDEPLNGVTTFDMVKISRHILGTTPLETPYQIIAADVNNSKGVTTMDLVEIRRLILTMIPNFNNNTSWRFVDAAYVFPNPIDPWQETFPEVIGYNNLAGNIANADFVAIKIGDVNDTASNNLMAADDRNQRPDLNFQTSDQFFEMGAIVEVPVYLSGYDNISGFQFTLEFDETQLSFIEVQAGLMKAEQLGDIHLQDGYLTGSWYQSTPLNFTAKTHLFSLQLRAKTDGQLSEVMSINSTKTSAEAYQEDGGGATELMNVQLTFEASATAGLVLHQNKPNPFTGATNIGFHLPASDKVIFTIFDTTGKVLKRSEGYYEAGTHELQITENELTTKGVLFYQLETSTEIVSKKMIKL